MHQFVFISSSEAGDLPASHRHRTPTSTSWPKIIADATEQVGGVLFAPVAPSMKS